MKEDLLVNKNQLYKSISEYAKACINYENESDSTKLDESKRLIYKSMYDWLDDIGHEHGLFLNYLIENKTDILESLANDDISKKDILYALYEGYSFGIAQNAIDVIESYRCENTNEEIRKECFKSVYSSDFFKEYRSDSTGYYANILSILLARNDMKYSRGIPLNIFKEEISITEELIKNKVIKIEKKKNGTRRMRIKIPQSIVNSLNDGIHYIAETIPVNMIINDVESNVDPVPINQRFLVMPANFDHSDHKALKG